MIKLYIIAGRFRRELKQVLRDIARSLLRG
jgi:hypothetical protein